MAIGEWSLEQLDHYIQQKIDEAANKQALPDRSLRMAGDTVIWDGEKWTTFNLIPDAGLIAKRVDYGSDSITWSFVGGTKSSNTTVKHSCQTVPKMILATIEASGTEAAIVATVMSITDTQFDVYGEYVTGAGAGGTQARTVYWMAIA